VKITVSIDRFTELRSKMRKAFNRGDDDARQEAFDEFTEYMRERLHRGDDLTLAEKLAFLEHGHGEEGWSKGYDWADIFCD
jgi:hypothetical protein